MAALKHFLRRASELAFTRVDIASLVFFRIAFGGIMVWDVGRGLARNFVRVLWIEPKFLFKYYGFAWVEPWPEKWLYIHYGAMGVFALFIMLGFCYRLSAALFCLSFTYFFLLDASLFVNHMYLACLVSFLLVLVPANQAFSIDAWLRPGIRSDTTPAWTIWLLRLQMGVVYLFAGIAKLTPDWFQGEPLRSWFQLRKNLPRWSGIAQVEWLPYVMSYGGVALDLALFPLLLWRRTRLAAFCVSSLFHLLNAIFFRIGFFPWFAIAATAMFLSPDWPRRVLSFFRLPAAKKSSIKPVQAPSGWKRNAILAFVIIYSAIQLLAPLRRFLYRGGIEWTYYEHRFSWQMMVRLHSIKATYYVTDPNTGRTYTVNPRRVLSSRRIVRMAWRPDMVVQFAHHLASVMPRWGPKPLQVETRTFVSINGRKPQLMIKPTVNLAAEKRPWGRPPWLLEVHEPLPPKSERDEEPAPDSE